MVNLRNPRVKPRGVSSWSDVAGLDSHPSHLLSSLHFWTFPSCTCALINKISPPSSSPFVLSHLRLSGGMGTSALHNSNNTTCCTFFPAPASRLELVLAASDSNHGPGRHTQPGAQSSGVCFPECLPWTPRSETCECCHSASASKSVLCIFKIELPLGFWRRFAKALRPRRLSCGDRARRNGETGTLPLSGGEGGGGGRAQTRLEQRAFGMNRCERASGEHRFVQS